MTGETRVLLVVAGGIAAYKALELIRRLREQSIRVRCILTRSGAEFVTPLSLSALTEDKVYGELFSLTDEAEMGHIQLSRDADLMVVAPATADLIAKMANGHTDDLASTALLATDKDVLIAPAMNVRMWDHPATQANIATLQARGLTLVGPNEGDMACGEFGFGRMAEPHEIVAAILTALGREPLSAAGTAGPLSGRSALITSGPTHEAIDPVRYIANRSSGKQGHAIARALSGLGAKTTLVTGPTQLQDPTGMEVIHIESAQQMLAACENALPADIAVCAAAVADWRVASQSNQKIKKTGSDGIDSGVPKLELAPNPDILASLSQRGNDRPELVVGFAAETEDVIRQATEKRARKACDWIIANDVSPESGTFGGADNTVHVIDARGVDSWARMDKSDVAQRLAERIADHFNGGPIAAAPAPL